MRRALAAGRERGRFMFEKKELPFGGLDLQQAVDLAQVVELEARWENLPHAATQRGVALSVRGLHDKQKAYAAYSARLAAYNGRYREGYFAKPARGTPPRLAAWLQAMRDLCSRVEHDPRCACPVHLVEKAYRWADRVALLLKKDPVERVPPCTTRAAIDELEVVKQAAGDARVGTAGAGSGGG